jgi:hypothetical protein
MFRATAEQIADAFQRNPLDFVAEADLQVALVEALRKQLSPVEASATDITLEGGSAGSFKREYWRTAQEQLMATGQLNRVHTEVSVEKGERIDVVVFHSELTEPIEWVSGGSKRFNTADIECAFELKFVKNKTSFPKHSGYPVGELASQKPSVETLLQRADSDDPILDFDENKIRADIHELNRLQDVSERYLLLFSNNNYLYQNPTTRESTDYQYGDLYHQMGKAAREWMRREATDGVKILYIHPRGMDWITG